MKKSIVLLELIISLLLFSIIAVVSSKMMYTLVKTNTSDLFITENNLILETTRLFLIKQNTLSDVEFRDAKLYFQNYLLLKNVSHYSSRPYDGIVTINICVHDNKICQTWKIKT